MKQNYLSGYTLLGENNLPSNCFSAEFCVRLGQRGYERVKIILFHPVQKIVFFGITEEKTLKKFISCSFNYVFSVGSSFKIKIYKLNFQTYGHLFFIVKKNICGICNGSSLCIMQSPICTNVHSVHCTIQGCVDKFFQGFHSFIFVGKTF